MFWTIIHRAVDIVLLVLALSLLSMVSLSATEQTGKADFVKRIELFQKETELGISKNTQYLESKINNVSERQDGYQVAMSRRADAVESRINELEKRTKGVKTAGEIKADENALYVKVDKLEQKHEKLYRRVYYLSTKIKKIEEQQAQ